MLTLGFFSPPTAGPMSSMLSRIQLGVRAAVRPMAFASTTRRGFRSVSNLSLDADGNASGRSCVGNISSNTCWPQRGHCFVCRAEWSRGFSAKRPTDPWCLTTRRGAAFQREAEADEKDVSAEEEGKENGGKMFAVESISPSSVAAFKQCPRLFYYRWVLRLRTPATRETLRGIAVHEVLSKYYELGEESRNLESLHELFRSVMTDLIAEEKKEPKHGYDKLFQTREEELAWAVECLDLLANFLVFERVNAWDGKPCEVEFKMRHCFDTASGSGIDNGGGGGGGETGAEGVSDQPVGGGVSAGALTLSLSGAPNDGEAEVKADLPGLNVTGIVDRLDRCRDGKLRVVDYKTGKIPNLKYSDATNQRIMDDKFYQLQIYALLVERVLGEVPREMRIVYLKGPESVTRELDPWVLPAVEKDLRSVWDQIASYARQDNFPPRQSRLCDWCAFKDRCPAFAVETPEEGLIDRGEDIRSDR